MTSTSTSWMPAQGKFPVLIGSSLSRALRARKQGGTSSTTNPKRNLPSRDFYSFRYNFKPPAIDSTKTGTMELKKGKEKTQFIVEHSSSQAGESYVFAGGETQAKDWDVVLLYDDETGTYTLEKLDSFLNLTLERKRTSAALVPSPAAPPTNDMNTEDNIGGDLEKELLGLAEMTSVPEARPSRLPPQREEEEEEEEEEGELIPIPSIQDLAPHPPKQELLTKPNARPTKPLPTPRPSVSTSANTIEMAPPHTVNASATLPKQTAAQRSKKRKEPESSDRQSDPEIEVLTFGKPTKRAKGSITSAPILPPQAPPSFALPGTSDSGFFQPPPAPTPANKPPKGNQNSSLSGGVDEDSEEEWEEVANADPPPRALSYHSDEGDIEDGLFGDEDGDANLDDELAAQLNAELGGDFLEAALSEPQTPLTKIPLSWDQLAATTGDPGGIAEDDSDDDFSSSDDSDDD